MSEMKTIPSLLGESETAEAREAELLWRNRQLTAFQRISEVMLADAHEQTLFDTIALEASEMTGFPMVAIELCDFDRSVMVYRGVHGIDLTGLPQPFEIPMDVTLSGRVAHSGEALIETEAATCRENSAPILRQLGMETLVCLPIRPNGTVIGTLSLANRARVHVDPILVKQAASLANYLAALFDRLHAREAV